jgi:hypothetical protein
MHPEILDIAAVFCPTDREPDAHPLCHFQIDWYQQSGAEQLVWKSAERGRVKGLYWTLGSQA